MLDGLTKPFQELPPKCLYDARGSELFERITEQPEYYPTRAELAVLRARRPCTARLAALDLRVDFAAGEELRTEISAKFTPGRIRADLRASGLRLRQLLTDPEHRFAISLSAPL